MKTLYLPLKKEWYEMIERGEKLEEYRAIKSYWITRLLRWYYLTDTLSPAEEQITREEADEIIDQGFEAFRGLLVPKHFDAVCFPYCYTKRRMTFECKGIIIGRGRPEWGAPDYNTFIIKLGKIL